MLGLPTDELKATLARANHSLTEADALIIDLRGLAARLDAIAKDIKLITGVLVEGLKR